MQVNNSTQMSFKSLYIIKGTARNVDKASTMIRRVCNSQHVQDILAFEMNAAGAEYVPPKKVLKNFTDCAYHYLTQVFSASQPLVQNLIATNEDAEVVNNYLYRMVEEAGFGESELEDIDSEDLKVMIINKLEDESDAIEAYERATEDCMQGNSKPLADFVLDSQIKAKECLNEILSPYDIPVNSVRVLRANDVIEGIENKQFNFMTGMFRGEQKLD